MFFLKKIVKYAIIIINKNIFEIINFYDKIININVEFKKKEYNLVNLILGFSFAKLN